MAVEVIRDEEKTLILDKRNGVQEVYYHNKDIEFSEEVMRIVRGTNMYQNCQNSKKKKQE